MKKILNLSEKLAVKKLDSRLNKVIVLGSCFAIGSLTSHLRLAPQVEELENSNTELHEQLEYADTKHEALQDKLNKAYLKLDQKELEIEELENTNETLKNDNEILQQRSDEYEAKEEQRRQQRLEEKIASFGEETVYVSGNGIFHSYSDAHGMTSSTKMTENEAIDRGYDGCSKCR